MSTVAGLLVAMAYGHRTGHCVDPGRQVVVRVPDDLDPDKRSHRTIVVAVRANPDDAITGPAREYAEARCRFAFGVTLFSAGTPMFLFGEEVGCQKDFKYNDVLKNREDFVRYRDEGRPGEHLFAFYRDIIRLRLATTALRSPNLEILHTDNPGRLLALRRFQHFLIPRRRS